MHSVIATASQSDVDLMAHFIWLTKAASQNIYNLCCAPLGQLKQLRTKISPKQTSWQSIDIHLP
ncbi:hypothetical protein CJU81_16040 [Pseudomonas fragi]|uniref:Uncharacterized protein n=1 Tax=Pseudomonas fragi TaxID=296 RepID=A0A267A8T8_PSEFR|nr:hypothetical protein CJU81_16040 [Pseudomonas fragi]